MRLRLCNRTNLVRQLTTLAVFSSTMLATTLFGYQGSIAWSSCRSKCTYRSKKQAPRARLTSWTLMQHHLRSSKTVAGNALLTNTLLVGASLVIARCVKSSRQSPSSESNQPIAGQMLGSEVPKWAQYSLTVLFDGACSVCLWEVDMLKRRQADIGNSSILFVDLAADDYDAQAWQGIDTVSAAGIEGRGIHGILQTGEVVFGIPVFRRIYDDLGWGWVFAAYGVPGLRELMEAGYYAFAVNRLKVTGRGDDDAKLRRILAQRASGADCGPCEAATPQTARTGAL